MSVLSQVSVFRLKQKKLFFCQILFFADEWKSGYVHIQFSVQFKKEFPLICSDELYVCLQVLYHHPGCVMFERSFFYFHSHFCIVLVGKIITLINNLWFQFVNQLGWICRSECKQCVPFWVHQNQFNLIKCDYSNIYHKRLLYVTHFTSSLHREKKLETFSAFLFHEYWINIII